MESYLSERNIDAKTIWKAVVWHSTETHPKLCSLRCFHTEVEGRDFIRKHITEDLKQFRFSGGYKLTEHSANRIVGVHATDSYSRMYIFWLNAREGMIYPANNCYCWNDINDGPINITAETPYQIVKLLQRLKNGQI